MRASTHMRVDPEALALLQQRTGEASPCNALRKLLGLPYNSTGRSGPKPRMRKIVQK